MEDIDECFYRNYEFIILEFNCLRKRLCLYLGASIPFPSNITSYFQENITVFLIVACNSIRRAVGNESKITHIHIVFSLTNIKPLFFI